MQFSIYRNDEHDYFLSKFTTQKRGSWQKKEYKIKISISL